VAQWVLHLFGCRRPPGAAGSGLTIRWPEIWTVR